MKPSRLSSFIVMPGMVYLPCAYDVVFFHAGEGISETTSCGPLKVMSTKCGVRDPEIQVLIFDTEALICNLLTEEDPLLTGN